MYDHVPWSKNGPILEERQNFGIFQTCRLGNILSKVALWLNSTDGAPKAESPNTDLLFLCQLQELWEIRDPDKLVIVTWETGLTELSLYMIVCLIVMSPHPPQLPEGSTLFKFGCNNAEKENFKDFIICGMIMHTVCLLDFSPHYGASRRDTDIHGSLQKVSCHGQGAEETGLCRFWIGNDTTQLMFIKAIGNRAQQRGKVLQSASITVL